IEWPAADRAALEAQRARGLAVVRYQEGEMELLSGCRVRGSGATSYRYTAITPKEESVVIQSADELRAAIPIHALALEAALTRKKRLEVSLLVVGTYETAQESFRGEDLEGECTRATHVVHGLTVGAFLVSAGASSGSGAGLWVAGAGGEARSSQGKDVLHRDGSREACAQSSARDAAPPYECGALLRVEVVPVSRARVVAPDSKGACPEGY